MKKIIALIVILAIPLVGLNFLGLSPLDLKANIEVGTGMGAKLACSGKYLTGLSEDRIRSDLASYSAATDALDIEYDNANKQVHVSLFGLSKTTATYRDGIGCALEIGDTSPLSQLTVPQEVEPIPLAHSVNTSLQALLEEMLDSDNAAGFDTRALVVAKGDTLIAEAYQAGFTQDTPLLGWSMGKSLTSIMLGNLAMRETLSVSDNALFPEWANDDRNAITLKHLLDMNSGLDFAEVYAPGSDATHMLFTAHSASDVAKASGVAHPPGAHFSYSSGTTNLLSKIYERYHGGPQGAINALYADIFQPLGMQHSVLEVDPSGTFVGSSYIYSSARDWTRLGILMLKGGEFNGHRIINQEWVAAAQQPNTSNNDPRYANQFWLNRGGEQPRWAQLPEDAFAMMGNREQVVMIIPSRDVVLVRLGWSNGRYPTAENFRRILDGMSNDTAGLHTTLSQTDSS